MNGKAIDVYIRLWLNARRFNLIYLSVHDFFDSKAVTISFVL